MSRSLSAGSSNGQQSGKSSDQGTRSYIGLKGLEYLEEQYVREGDGKGKQAVDSPKTVNEGEKKAIVTRIKMLRRLVEIRGEHVLDGQDLEKIVWLEGTNLHMTVDEELAVRLSLLF